MLCGLLASADKPALPRASGWPEALQAARAELRTAPAEGEARPTPQDLWRRIEREFPLQADWMMQDAPNGAHLDWLGQQGEAGLERQMIERVLEELGERTGKLRAQFQRLRRAAPPADGPRWLECYVRACEERRRIRLQPLLDAWPTIVFTKHYDLGGSHYAYTEGQSDAQRERAFRPGASLCLLELGDGHGSVRTLIDDPNGVIRDPDVSYNGNRVLFAWKKADLEDDYHLYEWDAASGEVRQLTSGLGFADYEGAYLPGGDIVFNSTRCVQTVDCWWTEVSNLYRCDPDGRYLRRLTFDQVHTNFPTVMADGRVIYTRWDYNDRGQIYPQPLFQMNADGTNQTEFYGNNSWFPTTILHARGLPNSTKALAVLSGHHCHQRGKLAVIDPAKGRQEAAGVQLIAPIRATEAVRVDAYGQDGEQFQYPYPLSETQFLVTFSPYGGNRKYPGHYAIYFMDVHGRRELLVADADVSCSQPVPLAPRPRPHLRPSPVDYREDTGVYYLHDVHAGPGLSGVPRGTIEWLRVIALDYRAAGVRDNRSGGPAGGALSSTPVSIGNGCWDVKVVLGDAKVYDDGSACFVVPARTPVYFQAIDADGYAAQTMRSWSTLQPGEQLSCVGCHEHKNGTPPAAAKPTLAMQAGPQPLKPFYGPPRGFSFPREVQPILDRHCIRCHHDRTARLAEAASPEADAMFSLLGEPNLEASSGRNWSDAYLALTAAYQEEKHLKGKPGRVVSWISVQSGPAMLPPYHAGAAVSPLMARLAEGHHDVNLTRQERDTVACWIDLLVPYCGDYTEANTWTEEEVAMYDHFLEKRRRMETAEGDNIQEFIRDTY